MPRYDEVSMKLTTGGDDRLPIDAKTGANKYHCSPVYDVAHICRGSCTCNSPSKLGMEVATQTFQDLSSGSQTTESVFADVRDRLSRILGLPEGTGVFLTPSGTDAEYLPLCFVKALHGNDKRILSVVTCGEEVGSGTLEAAGGLFFSAVEPIPGFISSGTVKKADPLAGVADNVQTKHIVARSADGCVVDVAEEVQKVCADSQTEGLVCVYHSVHGSKTGITHPVPAAVTKSIKDCGGLVVLDACQGRIREEQLVGALNEGIVVLYTCSKFFRGPPFAGAVLTPAPLMKQLASSGFVPPASLQTFMAGSQVPSDLPNWASALHTTQNDGLALRWAAGLAEMEATLSIPQSQREQAIQEWRKAVVAEIAKYDNLQYFDKASDTDSIICITLMHPETGAPMNKAECAKVFLGMTLDVSDRFTEPLASQKCFIGQPVVITKEHSVLRIALGSDSLRHFMKSPSECVEQDSKVVEKMSFLAKGLSRL